MGRLFEITGRRLFDPVAGLWGPREVFLFDSRFGLSKRFAIAKSGFTREELGGGLQKVTFEISDRAFVQLPGHPAIYNVGVETTLGSVGTFEGNFTFGFPRVEEIFNGIEPSPDPDVEIRLFGARLKGSKKLELVNVDPFPTSGTQTALLANEGELIVDNDERIRVPKNEVLKSRIGTLRVNKYVVRVTAEFDGREFTNVGSVDTFEVRPGIRDFDVSSIVADTGFTLTVTGTRFDGGGSPVEAGMNVNFYGLLPLGGDPSKDIIDLSSVTTILIDSDKKIRISHPGGWSSSGGVLAGSFKVVLGLKRQILVTQVSVKTLVVV